jgi:hypothetical protein
MGWLLLNGSRPARQGVEVSFRSGPMYYPVGFKSPGYSGELGERIELVEFLA